jgi:hypothetical protein
VPIARGELEKGTSELVAGNNPDIEKYHVAAGGLASDDVAWCSSFVNWCIRESHLHRDRCMAPFNRVPREVV